MKFLVEMKFRVSKIQSFGVPKNRPQVFLVLDKLIDMDFTPQVDLRIWKNLQVMSAKIRKSHPDEVWNALCDVCSRTEKSASEEK